MNTGQVELSKRLEHRSPESVTAFALGRARRPMVTTSFGQHSAAMLHLATRVEPDIPVVWIDTGWNTPRTYAFAAMLERRLKLRLHVYTPSLTRARHEALVGAPPPADDEIGLARFAHSVKVEPFRRALADLKPDLWLTGIRADETDWRRTQTIVSRTDDGLTKVAPFLKLPQADLERYIDQHGLPLGDPHYEDPAKAHPHRECGLHGPDETHPAIARTAVSDHRASQSASLNRNSRPLTGSA